MPNDVTLTQDNLTVARINGITVPTPTVANDGAVFTYNHSTGAYQLLSVSAISGASVTLAGDVTGASNANTVEKIQNTSVPAPSGGDNGKFLQYNSGSDAFVYASTSGGTEADSFYFRVVGTSPLERYYFAGQNAPVALITGSGATGTLRAFPFVSPRGGTLDRLAIAVTTGAGAGGVARWGIYTATSTTNVYPSALVVDAGEVDVTSIGVKSQTISVALSSSTLYWFVYIGGVSAATIRFLNANGCWPFLGYSNAFDSAGVANLNPGVGLTVAQAYGALPGTYPAGATVIVNDVGIPAIGCRFSA